MGDSALRELNKSLFVGVFKIIIMLHAIRFYSFQRVGALSISRSSFSGKEIFTSSLPIFGAGHLKPNSRFQKQNLFVHSSTTDNKQPSLLQENQALRKETDGDGLVEQYVVLQRNKQSLAFRNGSPLVFSGSVDCTTHRQIGYSDKDSNSIESGAIVGVVVMGDRHKKMNKSKSNAKGRGKNRKSGLQPAPKHFLINSSSSENLSDKDTEAAKSMLSACDLIGYGVYNSSSMYRVRILCHRTTHPNIFKQVKTIMTGKGGDDPNVTNPIEIIIKMKVQDAIRARMALNLPCSTTDSYRLLNGEGDGLSGLAIDIIGGQIAVIMSSALWCEVHRDIITNAVENVLCSNHPSYLNDKDTSLKLVWRNTPSRLIQDGYKFPENDEETCNDADDGVIVTENGIKYITFPLTAQKTGFYCDQRENRVMLSSYCSGKRVLDLCCYTGGFALNAAIHGNAASCVGIDSSQDAIDVAIKNVELNEVPAGKIQFLRDDIANYMKSAVKEDDEYDVIILDPPKLAPSALGIERASRKYHSLNRDALKLINKNGGIFLTCSCSAAMTQKDGGQFFLQTLQGAAVSAGRQITLLKTNGAAPCHTQCPGSFPAGVYLTAALFYVSPKNIN